MATLRDAVPCHESIIFPAIGDGAAGNLGSGATRPGFIAINVGTSAAVRAVPPVAARLPFGLFKFVIDSKRTLLGGAVSNAGNLRAWALRELRLPNDKRDLEKLLAKASAGAANLTILPFWAGERAPTWPENLSGTIVGLSQATTAADIVVAALVAVYYRLADILEIGRKQHWASEENHRFRRHPAIAGIAPAPRGLVRPRFGSLRRPGSFARAARPSTPWNNSAEKSLR